jgi:hypothetical protein
VFCSVAVDIKLTVNRYSISLPPTSAKADNAMALKSKKIETGKGVSKAASVAAGVAAAASGSSSAAAPASVPVVAGSKKKPLTAKNAHSDATGTSDASAMPSASSPLPSTSSNATQAVAPAVSDARSLDVANLALRFDTADSALSDGLIGRESLEIEDDDFKYEKSDGRPKYWVKKFMDAFAKDYLGKPEDTKKNRPEQKAWYARWQNKAHKIVVTIFEMKDPSHLEKCCWFLFDSIIKSHELGVFAMGAKNWSPSPLICSVRLAYTVTIIEKYAPVRLDIIRLWHVEEIAASPEDFIKRKLINCWNNGIRAGHNAKNKKGGKAAVKEVDEEEEAQASADVEEGEEAQAQAQAQASGDVEEGQELQAAPHHVKGKQALPPGENKTTVDGAAEGEEKAKGKGKANTKRAGTKKANTKRARSPSPEPRDTEANKKPATARKRPAVKKAPVDVGTKGRSDDKAAGAGAGADAEHKT